MTGFFSQVQNWLSAEKSGDFSGRYIALILEAWSKHDPKPFRSFLNDVFGDVPRTKLEVSCEVYLDKENRADIAIKAGDKLYALVEIKYNDSLAGETPEKDGQLDRYIKYAKENHCHLLVLTKGPLKADEVEKLKSSNHAHKHFDDLAEHLRGGGQLSELLLDFFKEKGFVMNKLDPKLLFRFFHRFVNPWNKSGKANLNKGTLEQAPQQFGFLLNNMQLLAQDITERLSHIESRKTRQISATVDFYVRPLHSRKALCKALENGGEDDDDIHLEGSCKTGGDIFVFAKNNLGNPGHWLSLQYGFLFEVRPDKEHKLSVYQYAELNCKGLQQWAKNENGGEELWACSKADISKHLEKSDKKPALIKAFHKLIEEAVTEALATKAIEEQLSLTVENIRKSMCAD